MNRILIKLTGVTTPDDARFAAEAGVDIVACVFFARSPRYVSPAIASSIRRAIGPSTAFHGVFVDTPAALVQRVVEQCSLDRVQFFGSESRAEVEAMGDIACKAISVRSSQDCADAQRNFVGRRPKRVSEPGLLLHLTGQVAHHWSLCEQIAERVPLILASSELHAETARAAAAVKPWALDVWEGVEIEPGILDRARLVAFVDSVRNAGG